MIIMITRMMIAMIIIGMLAGIIIMTMKITAIMISGERGRCCWSWTPGQSHQPTEPGFYLLSFRFFGFIQIPYLLISSQVSDLLMTEAICSYSRGGEIGGRGEVSTGLIIMI